MSLESRLEALAARLPGLDQTAITAAVAAHATPDAVAAALSHLVAQGRLACRDGCYRLAGCADPGAEQGGRPGPDPVRFGDWEAKGVCVDF
jgi:hypothetical protein